MWNPTRRIIGSSIATKRCFSDIQTQDLIKHVIGLSESGQFAEEIGVGGLDHVFDDLFRRILVKTSGDTYVLFMKHNTHYIAMKIDK